MKPGCVRAFSGVHTWTRVPAKCLPASNKPNLYLRYVVAGHLELSRFGVRDATINTNGRKTLPGLRERVEG